MISEDNVILGDLFRIGKMDDLDLRFEVVTAKLHDKRKRCVDRIQYRVGGLLGVLSTGYRSTEIWGFRVSCVGMCLVEGRSPFCWMSRLVLLTR